MAPSVAQLESAVADSVQVTKDALKSQSTESKDEVADKVRNFIHLNSCELMLRSRLGSRLSFLLPLLRR
jgi:hypothetical protein